MIVGSLAPTSPRPIPIPERSLTPTADPIRCRDAVPADIDAIVALMPRLAAFDVPAHRDPRDLWEGDAALLRAWSAEARDDVVVRVAVDTADVVLGVAAASDRADLLTQAPSAHLEALAVDRRVEGRGVARQLLKAIEAAVRERGATGLSLHVFGANARARALYARAGFDEEIVRCFKPFGTTATGR